MAQPSPNPTNKTGEFILGGVLGVLSGAVVCFFVSWGLVFLGTSLTKIPALMLGIDLAPPIIAGLGLGIWGFMMLPKKFGFLPGFAIGCAGGILGMTAVCGIFETVASYYPTQGGH